jgi:hypothetical protein
MYTTPARLAGQQASQLLIRQYQYKLRFEQQNQRR